MIEELVTECPDFAFIEYHAEDDYENVYSSARVTYYDVNVFPKTHIDGSWQTDWNNYDAYVEDYDERMAILTNYDVSLEMEGDGTNFMGTVDVSWFTADNTDKVLHLVLTESHIEESWYGGEELNYVARIMIPDQHGTPLETDSGAEDLFDFEFTLEETWEKDNCELVAFVQDTVTQEVLQANSMLLSDVEIAVFDIELEAILNPGDEHCLEVISPEIKVRNHCSDYLNSFEVLYEINGESYSYSWTGNMWPNVSQVVILPEVPFELLDENSILITLSMPNGEADQNPEDDFLNKDFDKSVLIEADQLVLEILSDDFGDETQWEIINGTGEIILEGGPYDNNTLHTLNLDLPGDDCYTFAISDAGGNGICCDNGEGYYKIKDQDNNIFFEGGDFGAGELVLFELDITIGIADLGGRGNEECILYPNPASSLIYFSATKDVVKMTVYNHTGQVVYESNNRFKNKQLNIEGWDAGLYFLRIQTTDRLFTKTFLVN